MGLSLRRSAGDGFGLSTAHRDPPEVWDNSDHRPTLRRSNLQIRRRAHRVGSRGGGRGALAPAHRGSGGIASNGLSSFRFERRTVRFFGLNRTVIDGDEMHLQPCLFFDGRCAAAVELCRSEAGANGLTPRPPFKIIAGFVWRGSRAVKGEQTKKLPALPSKVRILPTIQNGVGKTGSGKIDRAGFRQGLWAFCIPTRV